MLCILPSLGYTGDVTVVNAKISCQQGNCTVSVTLEHEDTGWEHYADGWQLAHPDGTVLGERTLYHPHEDEQPFTRSLSGVSIPADVTEVLIRGHDNVHGFSSRSLRVKIDAD